MRMGMSENLIYDENDLDRTFLPVGEMRHVQRIIELTEGEIVGEKDLREDEWFFHCIFRAIRSFLEAY